MHNRYSVIAAAAFLMMISGSEPLSAQNGTTNSDPQRPKVGIALSGGGAKGLAHIGVLKVLEEVNMPIDYITGTSMGAMIGGLYSIGYSPEYLQDLSNNLDWSELFSDEVYRRYMPMEDKYWDGRYLLTLPFSGGRLRLPRGLVAGQQISMLLSNLTWQYHGTRDFMELPIPFACIATDLDSGEAVLLNEGVLSESIRASISIPTVFTPVRIGGKSLIDGGVVRNLPISDVREMGADIVIGINVTEGLKHSDSLRTILDIMDQTVGFKMYQSVSDEVKLADIIIEPDVKRFSILDFQSTMLVIDEGERAAREMYDELKALADSLNGISEWRQRDVLQPDNIESVRISGIRINGLQYYSEDRLRSELQLEIGIVADPQVITSAIERLYSMQYFRHINYYLEPDIADGEKDGSNNISGSNGSSGSSGSSGSNGSGSNGTNGGDSGVKGDGMVGGDNGPDGYLLNINVTEREQSTFSFGFRYDNYTSASLLFNNTFRNLVTASSTLQLNARLGQEISLDAQLIRYIGTSNLIGFQGRMNYLLERIDIYNDDGIRESRFDNNAIYAELMFFPVASSSFLIGGGFREELFSTSSSIGFLDLDQRWSNLNLLNGLIWIDTMDRTFFPRSGHTIRGQALRAFSVGDDARSFLKLELIWNSFYELGNRTTLTHRGHAGYIYGNNIPLHHQLHMSGDLGFMGLKRYEINASNMRWMQLGIRYEFYESTFIHPVFNVGNTRDVLDINLVNQPYQWGWGLSFGMQTLIAPVQFTFMGGDRHDLLVMFSIGFTF